MARYRSEDPCIVCGEDYLDRCYHHLYSRGSNPQLKDKDWNKIPVCMWCHITGQYSFHSKGTEFMAARYVSVEIWLVKYEWELDKYSGNWVHEH